MTAAGRHTRLHGDPGPPRAEQRGGRTPSRFASGRCRTPTGAVDPAPGLPSRGGRRHSVRSRWWDSQREPVMTCHPATLSANALEGRPSTVAENVRHDPSLGHDQARNRLQDSGGSFAVASQLEDGQRRGGRGHGPSGAEGARPASGAAAPPSRFLPSRELVRRRPCPTCAAAAGQPCRGRRGDRRSHHLARAQLALSKPMSAAPKGAVGDRTDLGSATAHRAAVAKAK